jgi:hypothetical protein
LLSRRHAIARRTFDVHELVVVAQPRQRKPSVPFGCVIRNRCGSSHGSTPN